VNNSAIYEEDTYSVDVSDITDADGVGTLNYQWYADDIAIVGAIFAEFTPDQAEVGKRLHVKVSYIDGLGYEEVFVSEKTAAVTNVNDAASGQVVIVGEGVVGETLAADASNITDEDGLTSSTFSYQWYRNNVAITNATNASYLLTSADLGTSIHVKVSFVDDYGHAEMIKSSEVIINQGDNHVATGSVDLQGIAKEDETLSVVLSNV
ncbi:hypothetical protein, partial [Cysteiniphilum litorale]|uniref:hypothetical protein n=1 Tax=Cysteiniphilum litorale TaxID=2056700 RepID=UPI003F88159F